ncbi:nucleotidyltransferase domain-containing protein [Bradyrhizobium sp. CCBAU 21362]|uniref:nucleotidyltransferase domain-containing protein n=1 Tax=Bradyrhizobium sp. CCBAU 21362 TaxID=1325082 RepID=UPI003FA46000
MGDTLPNLHGSVCLPETARASLQLLLDVREVQKVVLFGSRAVGDHEERSDFDIAVSAPGLSRGLWVQLRDRVVQSRTLYRLSMTRLEDMPGPLRESVLSQGITLYERPQTQR